MVVLRNRSLSVKESSTPLAQVSRKSTPVHTSQRDEVDEILKCIVVRSPFTSQLITSKSERSNRTGTRKPGKPALYSRLRFSKNALAPKSSAPSVQQTPTDSDVEKSLVSLRNSPIRPVAVEGSSMAKSTPGHIFSVPETQNDLGVLPGSPQSSMLDNTSEGLSTIVLKPYNALWNAPSLRNHCETSATPLFSGGQQVLNSDEPADDVSDILINQEPFTVKLSTPMTRSKSARSDSSPYQQSHRLMGHLQEHSYHVSVPKGKSPGSVPSCEGNKSGIKPFFHVKNLVKEVKAPTTELHPGPSRGAFSMGETHISGGTRVLRERREAVHRPFHISAKKGRRSKKGLPRNSLSDELLESITLKPPTASIRKGSQCKEKSTENQIPATLTVGIQSLDRAQGYQSSKPDILASVLPTNIPSKSEPRFPLDLQRCSEKDESNAYVETLLLMSGLSPEAVNSMLSQGHSHCVV